MILVQHPHKLLQCLHRGEGGEFIDGLGLQCPQVDAVWGDFVAKRLDPEGALVETYDKTIVLEFLKDLASVGIEVLCGLGGYLDVIHIADAEREIAKMPFIMH